MRKRTEKQKMAFNNKGLKASSIIAGTLSFSLVFLAGMSVIANAKKSQNNTIIYRQYGSSEIPDLEPDLVETPLEEDPINPLLFPPSFPPVNPPPLVGPIPYTGPDRSVFCNQPVFVKDYFKNLSSNFPTNNADNCGYVAAAMLLSYYDTYWNDAFVSNNYKSLGYCELEATSDTAFDSPGVQDIYEPLWTEDIPYVQRPEFWDNEETEAQYNLYVKRAYWAYLERMFARDCIISNLYILAKNNYYYSDNQEIKIYDIVNQPIPWITIKGLGALLECYFAEISQLDGFVTVNTRHYTDYVDEPDEGSKRLALRNEALQKIISGTPIIFAGDLANSDSGHICIAYDYNQEAGDIYGHLGWKDSSLNFANLDYYYGTFNDFLWIDISPELKATKNNNRFRINSETPCSSFDLYSHVHGYTTFSYSSDVHHVKQCGCGTTYALHSFIDLSSDVKRCTVCHKTVTTPSQEV